MPALFLNILKLIFIALIYLFLWVVARSIGSHIGTTQTSRTNKRAVEMVVVKSDSIAGERFPVGPPEVIGCSDEADIVIKDPYASDFHVRVGVQDGMVLANDLGSTNGTYINGRRVTIPTPLQRGDMIQIGKTVLEVR